MISIKTKRLLSYDIRTHQRLKPNKQKNRKVPTSSIRDCIAHQHKEVLRTTTFKLIHSVDLAPSMYHSGIFIRDFFFFIVLVYFAERTIDN